MSGNFCTHEERKARKPHRCVECRGTIAKGEVHHYYSGAWEGSGFSVRRCPECDTLYHRYVSESTCMDDERPAFGELGEHIFESEMSDLLDEFNRNKERRRMRP